MASDSAQTTDMILQQINNSITTLIGLVNNNITTLIDIADDNNNILVNVLKNQNESLISSCQDIKNIFPTSPSGYYHVNGQQVYCEMGELCGIVMKDGQE